jgi:ankyrin repeat protein
MKSRKKYEFGPLTDRVFRDNSNELAILLAGGTDPDERDSDGRTPLMHAAIDNKLDIARILLDARADSNA